MTANKLQSEIFEKFLLKNKAAVSAYLKQAALDYINLRGPLTLNEFYKKDTGVLSVSRKPIKTKTIYDAKENSSYFVLDNGNYKMYFNNIWCEFKKLFLNKKHADVILCAHCTNQFEYELDMKVNFILDLYHNWTKFPDYLTYKLYTL